MRCARNAHHRRILPEERLLRVLFGQVDLGDKPESYPIDTASDEMKAFAAYYPGVYTDQRGHLNRKLRFEFVRQCSPERSGLSAIHLNEIRAVRHDVPEGKARYETRFPCRCLLPGPEMFHDLVDLDGIPVQNRIDTRLRQLALFMIPRNRSCQFTLGRQRKSGGAALCDIRPC